MAKIVNLIYGKTNKQAKHYRKSEIYSLSRKEILNYHMEQAEEKQCCRNTLMEKQILGTLQQWIKIILKVTCLVLC